MVFCQTSATSILLYIIFPIIILCKIYSAQSDELNSSNQITLENQTDMLTTISANNSNNTVLNPPTKNVPWEIFIFIINGIIFVVGVTGNILIALTIIKQKSMRNLQNYFVFSLAVTDLFMLLLLQPWYMMTKYVSWPFGEICCKYFLPIAEVLPAVSILMLVSISIDRYRAIIYTLSQTPSLRAGVVLIVVIWIAAYMIAGLPLTFTFRVGPGIWVSKTCYNSWDSEKFRNLYFSLRTVLFYIIPSILIFFCYIRVNASLKTSLKFIEDSVTGEAQIARLQNQKKIMNMFLAIFVTFFLCYLPVNFITMILIMGANISRWKYASELFQFTTLFVTANSTCNPIILYRLSRAYRESFQKYLPFLKQCFKKKTGSPHVADTDAIIVENTSIQLHLTRSQQIHASFRC